MAETTDLAEQALSAKEQGLIEVIKLLQHPEDLSRLADITTEYESRHRSAKATLSAMVQSQVEATRLGMDLLERAHRHITKLQAALDRIDKLCAECADLVHHHDKIKLLALTHGNVKKADDANLVPAFEALVLLTGTAENAKQAWQRNNKSAAEVSELAAYLARVDEVLVRFEQLLLGQHLRLPGLITLAQERPTLLVDCVRVMELQELLDSEYKRVKMGSVQQRRYKDRFFAGLLKDAEGRFKPLLKIARACNKPNMIISYDINGDRIVSEQRDYLGALVKLTRLVNGEEEVVDDPEELQHIDIIQEEVFDEATYLDELLNGLYDMTDELAAVYDYVAPCFPPGYDVFNRCFQTYHVQFSVVVDVMGHGAAEGMSTAGALRVMDWVQKYMETLRNLGVDEELVRLPPSPLADPDSLPGMVVLMESYVKRMADTVTRWYTNILDADLSIAIITDLNEHGEIMLQTAKTALRIMVGFQEAQKDVLGGYGREGGRKGLGLEMAVAFLNNAVHCHDQSLEFAEDVGRQLKKEYREQLDVETVCRGFLEVAKVAAFRAVVVMFNDPGMSGQLKGLYGTGPGDTYLSGRVTSTLIATLRDYFSDIKTWVTPSFVKRVAEAALEELVRRAVNIFAVAPPQASEPLSARMESDVSDLSAYFEAYVTKADRLRKHLEVLADLRELLVADSPETFALAYSNLLAYNDKAFTPELVAKITSSCRSDLTKKQISDISSQCRDLWKQHEAAAKAAAGGGGAADKSDGWWFGWGKKG
eukprot:XP_001703598.1 component of the exocyst complex [Chlamydomonas reinhardtii]